MALINEVYEYIENKYKPNEPIFLAELDIPDMKPVSVRQQMKKLTEEGRLKRFDAGIYYIPKKSMFGFIRFSFSHGAALQNTERPLLLKF